jgi:hypothetical protein
VADVIVELCYGYAHTRGFVANVQRTRSIGSNHTCLIALSWFGGIGENAYICIRKRGWLILANYTYLTLTAGIAYWIKRLAAICLLIGFAAPVATTFAVLQWQKKQIRKEVKWRMIDGIDREELVLLGFPTKDLPFLLNWKHAAEFEYRGEMYDIVETYTEGDSTFYRVWWDYEETFLNRKLQQLIADVASGDPGHRENQERLLHFFKTLYHVRYEGIGEVSVIRAPSNHYAPQSICTQIFPQPLSPPPERC